MSNSMHIVLGFLVIATSFSSNAMENKQVLKRYAVVGNKVITITIIPPKDTVAKKKKKLSSPYSAGEKTEYHWGLMEASLSVLSPEDQEK